MKSLLTITLLAILAGIGLTLNSDNALSQQDPRATFQQQQQLQQQQLQQQQLQPDPQQPTSPNDWGEVVSGNAQGGSFGQHSSNPVPDDPNTLPQYIDRETPRGGVGNQEPEKHPSFHANQLCTNFPGAPGCENITP